MVRFDFSPSNAARHRLGTAKQCHPETCVIFFSDFASKMLRPPSCRADYNYSIPLLGPSPTPRNELNGVECRHNIAHDCICVRLYAQTVPNALIYFTQKIPLGLKWDFYVFWSAKGGSVIQTCWLAHSHSARCHCNCSTAHLFPVRIWMCSTLVYTAHLYAMHICRHSTSVYTAQLYILHICVHCTSVYTTCGINTALLQNMDINRYTNGYTFMQHCFFVYYLM